MREAFYTDAPAIFETTLLHLEAVAVFSEVISTFTSHTAKVIVGLALFNCALIVRQDKGFVALKTSVICLLLLAPEKAIVLALVED